MLERFGRAASFEIALQLSYYAGLDIKMRPLVTMHQLWVLATTRYSARLQENSRRPQPDEMRSIFADLGLADDFWDPQSDTFG